MGTPILVKFRTAAMATPALTALLGSTPFRWYDTQLTQGSAYPAVVALVVSDVKDYSLTGRLATGWVRVQFTIWGGRFTAGGAMADAVLDALTTFLDSFNAEAIAGLNSYPTYIVNVRRGLYAQTDGPIYQWLVDVKTFNNDSA